MKKFLARLNPYRKAVWGTVLPLATFLVGTGLHVNPAIDAVAAAIVTGAGVWKAENRPKGE